MIAGASWTWWVGFHIAVFALLAVDALLTHKHRNIPQTQAAAWTWTTFLAIGAALFAGWIAFEHGRQPALEFVAGYTIEISLSIDNLFVFLVLFHGLHIDAERQHRALLWGVLGAIVMRGMFIAAGVALLERFAWITWIFGLLLLYAAWRLLRGGAPHAAVPAWIQRLHASSDSLLPVILAVELTDLLFAVDSIPAVLAVSHNPFVVYTSNIAAILGLRSLYFALAALLGRFRYLHYGLGVLLGFVAFKMLAAHWLEIPIIISLAIMGLILGVCAVVSWKLETRQP
ncbi:MAG: branched-chain amino acid ABC transporter substrate-binding protein [Terracidiphilus sp.]